MKEAPFVLKNNKLYALQETRSGLVYVPVNGVDLYQDESSQAYVVDDKGTPYNIFHPDGNPVYTYSEAYQAWLAAQQVSRQPAPPKMNRRAAVALIFGAGVFLATYPYIPKVIRGNGNKHGEGESGAEFSTMPSANSEVQINGSEIYKQNMFPNPFKDIVVPDINLDYGISHPAVNSKYDYHVGIDWPVPSGTPLYAVSDGVRVIQGKGIDVDNKGWGQRVSFWINPTLHYSLSHLSEIVIAKGQLVKKGQLIGYSGATGDVTGAHVHLDMHNIPFSEFTGGPNGNWHDESIYFDPHEFLGREVLVNLNGYIETYGAYTT